MLWLIVLVFIIVLVYIKFVASLDHWKKRNVFQLKPKPFFGDFLPLVLKKTSMGLFLRDLSRKYSDHRYIGLYCLNVPWLVINDADLIKKVLIKDFDVFPERRAIVNENLDPLVAKSLLFMKGGDKWHKLRSTLSPVFTSNKMKLLFNLICDCAQNFVTYLEKHDKLVEVDISKIFGNYTNDVIGNSAFGVAGNSFENPDNDFLTIAQLAMMPFKTWKIFVYATMPQIMTLLRYRLCKKAHEEFLRNIVHDSIEWRTKKNIVRLDLIHFLMEARKGTLKDDDPTTPDKSYEFLQDTEAKTKAPTIKLTDDDIAAQAFIFYLAGFDTTSIALSFISYELAINLDIQIKLQDEIDEVANTLDNGKGITYESLSNMSYMDAVVLESLRKWPPVIFSERVAVKPYKIDAELPGEQPILLEPGTALSIPIFAIHRSEKYFPNPDKFDPNRFYGKNKSEIKAGSYLPFGLGPRICIGSRLALIEVKLMLFFVLSKFTIVPLEGTSSNIGPCGQSFLLEADKGCTLGFKRRVKS